MRVRLLLLCSLLAGCQHPDPAPAPPAPTIPPCEEDLRGWVCCSPDTMQAVLSRAQRAEARAALCTSDGGAR